MATFEQLEAEEKAAEALLNPAQEVTPEKETEPPAEEVKPEKEEIAEPAPDGAAAASDTPLPDADKATPEKKEKTEDEQTWKAKYDTLKGKYDKETPRAIREAHAKEAEAQQWKDHAVKLQSQVTSLQKEVARLNAKPKDTKAIDELSVLHPEVADVIKKIQEDHATEIQTLRDDIKQGVSAAIEPIQGELQESKEERFDRVISTVVPEWKILDKDERFFTWLQETVPYTNSTRQQLLVNAATGFKDPTTVAQFFSDFKKTLEASAPEDKQKKLEKFVAPPKSTVASAPGKVVQPTYTWAQYDKFMSDSAKGFFDPKKWNDQTESQVEAMFDKAILENRMV
jgi:gas vesicle protein